MASKTIVGREGNGTGQAGFEVLLDLPGAYGWRHRGGPGFAHPVTRPFLLEGIFLCRWVKSRFSNGPLAQKPVNHAGWLTVLFMLCFGVLHVSEDWLLTYL